MSQSFIESSNSSCFSVLTSHPKWTADSVVMVPPKEFSFNPQTAADNEFQHQLNLSPQETRAQAMAEYRAMVAGLRRFGVEVIEFDYDLGSIPTPDAVFPNNWFCTHSDGSLHLFPMACRNRRMEVRGEALRQLLERHQRRVTRMESGLMDEAQPEQFLESTGVMITDHVNRHLYAGLSQRCDETLLKRYAAENQLEQLFSFHTALPSGAPIYHTNVMMAIGEQFCVICDEIIPEFERRNVIKQLSKTKQVIRITLEQMNRFCGNILQLQNFRGEKCIAMSQSAFKAWTPEQRAQLERHGKLLAFDVSTIESIGGGSVRCMLAEVFLPK